MDLLFEVDFDGGPEAIKPDDPGLKKRNNSRPVIPVEDIHLFQFY